MARFFDCIGRLNQAAGRTLTDAEVGAMFEKIHKAALDLNAGRKTPSQVKSGQGQALDQVVVQVAQDAAAQYAADAARRERNAALQAVRLAQRADDVKAMTAAGLSPLNSVKRLIANQADGRANQFSLENRYLGVVTDMKRRLADTWTALGDDFVGFVQDAQKIGLLVREMRGEATGDALAAKGAKAWLDMTEQFRKRFNDSGGEIGKLDDWGLPQHHSQELVARAGRDAWVNAILPALDRAKYVDDLGRQWADPQLREFLAKAYDTISTNGYANIKPGEYTGRGAVSNRHAESRQIHFKDADAYLNYWGQFGDKTFTQILDGHVESLARDLAFIEHFGPDADSSYRTLRDTAIKDQAEGMKDRTKLGSVDREAARADKLWNHAAGKTIPVADMRIARLFDTIRNLNVAGKLGSAFWASFFGDKVMMETASHLNGLPALQRWSNELRMLNPANGAERAMLQRQGLMLEYMRSAMARWGDELGSNAFTGKLANAVMRVSGMNAINEWRRGAFGLSLMDALGRSVATKDFGAIDKTEMRLLQSYGIDAKDWSIWKLAKLEDVGHGNDQVLTPDAIAGISDDALRAAHLIGQTDGALIAQRVRQESITKLLGAISSESRYAIIEPGWRTRAKLYGNLERGTLKGEIIRSFWQFKSFPLAQLERMWDVAMSRPSFGGKVGTLSALMGMQLVAGAMILQTRETLLGKDPRPMDWKFGLAAFLNGGSLGIYGDFLYGLNQTRQGTGPLEIIAGPTIGPFVDALTSSANAMKAASEGKETHLAAKYMTIAKGFVPAGNLWYTKAATDHLIFQNIQEMLNPGYLSSMRARTMKDFRQDWWWEPGQSSPSRAPDLSSARPQ